MVRSAPLRERRWTLLALAQYQAGNQAEALRTIHGLKSVLLSQLGIDPGPDVVALEQAILRQDSSLLSGAPVGAAGSQLSLAGTDGLRHRTMPNASSVARTTSTPASTSCGGRRSSRWWDPPGPASPRSCAPAWRPLSKGEVARSITVTPGRHPLQSLTVLDRAPATAVLCIDQTEEVFSLCEEPDEQREFLDTLVDAGRGPVGAGRVPRRPARRRGRPRPLQPPGRTRSLPGRLPRRAWAA